MMLQLKAPMTGRSIPLEQVPDEMFATNVLGKGVAIDPEDGLVVAPCDGVITAVANTMHAICLRTDDGADILLHIGIDTVKLSGKGFTCYVKKGQRVKEGEKLMKLDLAVCCKAQLSPISPLLVIDPDQYQMQVFHTKCLAGQTVLISLEKTT